MTPAHLLTWDALRASAQRGKRFSDLDGLPLWPEGDPFDDWSAYAAYCIDVARAVGQGLAPLPVELAYHARVLENEVFGETTRHLVLPKKIFNEKNRPFSWSYTALEQFQNCPNQYAEHRFFCNIPFEETDYIRWGNEVHKAMEDRIRHGKPLPDSMKQWEKFPQTLEAAAVKHGGDLTAEQEMTLTRHFTPCGWFDNKAFVRSKVDAIIKNENTMWLYDWKTGKTRHKPLQLLIFAVKAAVMNPEIDHFKTRYIWLSTGEVTGEDYHRSNLVELFKPVLRDVARMQRAWQTRNFQCRTSGLCRGWCQVTDCVHWEPKR